MTRPFLPLAAATLLAFFASPVANPAERAPSAPGLERAQAIVKARCADCHATLPTFSGVSSAPNGVVLEQPSELKRHAERIGARLAAGSMPPANVTGLTDEERAELLAWAKAARKPAPRR